MELHRSRELKKCHEELPSGADGLNDSQVDLITNALTIGEHKMHDVYTPIDQVKKIYLGSKMNEETMRQISDAGFSRVPIAFSQEHPVIVGVLLVKTCLGIEPSDEHTIAELYMQGKLSLKVPPYMPQDAKIQKVSQKFSRGNCHMGIVCAGKVGAHFFRDFCDHVHTQMKNLNNATPSVGEFDFEGKTILGVVTLEDIIERTLRIDINDEGDRDEAIQALQMRTKEELKANDINFESLAPYMQIKYAQENDQVDSKGEIEEFAKEGIFISKLGSG